MNTLDFKYNNKVISVKLTIKEKHMSEPDYIIEGKNGYSLYYFRKEGNKWRLAYGSLEDSLRDAIIEALKLRFDTI